MKSSLASSLFLALQLCSIRSVFADPREPDHVRDSPQDDHQDVTDPGATDLHQQFRSFKLRNLLPRVDFNNNDNSNMDPERENRALQGIPTAAEAAALTWLNGNPQVASFSEERRQQLLSMATFYFASLGDTWANNTDWLSYTVNECSWFNQAGDASEVCDENGFLIELDLEENLVGGSIPEAMYELRNLTSLDLEDNMIGGRLSPNIRNWNEMIKFQINKNQIEFRIPQEMISWRNVEEIDMSENRLTGTIPDLFGQRFQTLEIFNLYWNAELTGTVPLLLWQWPSIRELILEFNYFTGTIPTEIGVSKTLEVLSKYYACSTRSFLVSR